jgi:hypothetical protein
MDFGFGWVFERFVGFSFLVLEILVDFVLKEKPLKLLFFNWG